jgi:LPS sulfotransferase NodH
MSELHQYNSVFQDVVLSLHQLRSLMLDYSGELPSQQYDQIKQSLEIHSLHRLSGLNYSETHLTDFDQAQYRSPPNIYVIASQRRSGSHYLASLLRATGKAGVPLEYFHRAHWKKWLGRTGQRNPPAIFRIICRYRTTPNGIFGVKAHWDQFKYACHLRLEQHFRSAKFIQITRDDTLSQAISLVIATQTASWASYQRSKADPEYSYERIEQAIITLARERSSWDKFFAITSINPHSISYEDLCSERDAVMDGVCNYLGIKWCRSLHSPLLVQRSAINNEWKRRFVEESQTRMTSSGKRWRELFCE